MICYRHIHKPQGATFVVAANDSLHKERADYVCDGVDDQVEINNALTAANGGRVRLLEGIYIIDDSINLGSHNTLEGVGAATKLKVPNEFDNSIHIIDMGSYQYCTVANLFIDGNKDNQSAGNQQGIYMNGGSHHKIINLFLYNIYGVEGNGIFVAGIPADVLIQGNILRHIQDDGMDINGIIKSRIIGNYIDDIGSHTGHNGIDTEGAEYCTFSGNVIGNCADNGLELEQEGTTPPLTRYCTVTGNTIYNSGGDGIHMRSGGYNSVVGNVIKASGRYGIYLTKTPNGGTAEHNIISNNLIVGSTSEGIYEVSGNADYNFYTGNYLRENGGAYPENITGLHSQSFNDYWTDDEHYPIVEKKIRVYKNYSGATVSAGSVITLYKDYRGYLFDTTTTKGDDLVIGMTLESIDHTGLGSILIEGKTDLLKVNGTTDIAIGDFLGTYTEAGIVCKAEAGDMAFAIALEAYTGNDSNGVINALLRTPRKI